MWTAKVFEEKMAPFIDDIYKEIFTNKLLEIKRSNRDIDDVKTLFMDINLSIDTHLKFKNGSVLTFQEKTRRYKYLNYNEFTFEYYNDPNTNDEGEWFKLASQLYFYGYANKSEDGYSKYWILNVARLRTGLMKYFTLTQLETKFLQSNRPPAKANFFAIPFKLLGEIGNIILFEKNNEL